MALALTRQFRPNAWQGLISHPRLLIVTGFLLLACGLAIYPIDDKPLSAWLFTFPLISLGFGSLLIAAQAPKRRPLPGASTVATLAFTLYLTHKQMIHLAVLSIGDPDQRPALFIALALIYTVLAAGLLHLAVERPCLRLRDRFLKPQNQQGRNLEGPAKLKA